MTFACQRNSYLKELVSKVMSCVAVKNGFEVVLNDTVFFPEGGGQPDDHGLMGGVNVKQVIRRGPQAVHLTDGEIKTGDEVNCSIDWKRRFDHMQQHSAQHLLSAILESRYGFETTSWELGRTMSQVELNTSKITSEQLYAIEAECNEHIRNHLPVVVHYLTKTEVQELDEVKTRGLPDDVAEPIRVIEITGVDKNMCCGTHVSNLSDLQVIKLLHTDTARGGTRLFFLAGNRVVDKLSSTYEVERKLTKLLSCGLEEHGDSVEKLKGNLRVSLKSNRSYLKEVATFEAKELSQKGKESHYVFKHREDGDKDYVSAFMNNLSDEMKDCIVFVCCGAVKTGGQFVLRGPDDKISTLMESISPLIDGKGGGKKGYIQGKASSFKKLKNVEELIKNAVTT